MFTIPIRRFITCLVLGLVVPIATLPLATPAEAGWHSLTGVLPVHAGIDDLKISPNSRYVVFTADIKVDERDERYSVPITGTMPIKLNPPLVAGGQVYGVAITPDSQYVIYTAKHEEGDSYSDLYRVPITGGPAVKLNVAYFSGRNVADLKIDPDNVRVVYQAEKQVPDQLELLSVPIAGGLADKCPYQLHRP